MTALLAAAELAFGGALGLLLLLFLALGALAVRKRYGRRRALAAVVARHGGTIEVDGAGVESGVRFDASGVAARLDAEVGSEASKPFTRLELALAGEARVSLVPRALFSAASAAAEDEQVGDPIFDAHFRVTCEPAGSGSALFDAEARRVLLELHDLGGHLLTKGVSLTIGAASSWVQVPRDLVRDPATIVAFVDRSLALLLRLRAVRR